MRSPGILPCECASALRGSLDVRPCTFSERPRIVRGLLRTFPSHARRITGGPISAASCRRSQGPLRTFVEVVQGCTASGINGAVRSEEHTSELQSQFHLVCRLLLEKKKKNQ